MANTSCATHQETRGRPHLSDEERRNLAEEWHRDNAEAISDQREFLEENNVNLFVIHGMVSNPAKRRQFAQAVAQTDLADIELEELLEMIRAYREGMAK